jgi:hypothetical protein
MTVTLGIERPFSADVVGAYGENYRAPLLGTTPVAPVGQTVPLHSVGATALTTVTATIHCASIVLPQNQNVSGVGLCATVAGTVTGFWVALLDASRIVRAVSANATSVTTGHALTSVLPASAVPYRTTYAGLYYIALGTVSSVAAQVAASAALPSVAAVSGPPVYCGTSSTAATTTPPTVGTQLGALTGVASNQFYAGVYA